VKRLAFFWLLCAAIGFAIAATAAVVISLTLDHRPAAAAEATAGLQTRQDGGGARPAADYSGRRLLGD
jgi:hypothetical protein